MAFLVLENKGGYTSNGSVDVSSKDETSSPRDIDAHPEDVR